MIRHAQEGKIDYILVKSISRFARSTTDTIVYLQKLKEMGVGCYFLEQGIDTLSNIGHTVIDALATIAEEGSRDLHAYYTQGKQEAGGGIESL